MDQMASALGHEAQLLALRCQPAEVQGAAPIPPHLQFWGVDSGAQAARGLAGSNASGASLAAAFAELLFLPISAPS